MASLNERLIAAVRPVAGVCVPDLYLGEQEIYCTFNFTEIPSLFGDDISLATLYLVQLHLFLPLKAGSVALRRQLRDALVAAGFTAPTIANATDELTQHYVYEFQTMDWEAE